MLDEVPDVHDVIQFIPVRQGLHSHPQGHIPRTPFKFQNLRIHTYQGAIVRDIDPHRLANAWLRMKHHFVESRSPFQEPELGRRYRDPLLVVISDGDGDIVCGLVIGPIIRTADAVF